MSKMAGNHANSTHVVPLNGTNYPTWKIQCKMALMKDNLWGIVSGTETEPQDPGDDETRRKFVVRRDRALATIVLTVDPSLLYLIGEPENPGDVWQKLQDQFQKRTWANKLALKRRLYSLRLVEGEPVQDHIKAMTEIFSELAVVGDPVENEDQVVQLLASLPESYEMLVTALETSMEVPEMDTVVERLLHEERKLQEKAGGLEKAMASKEKKGPRCYKCKDFGHIRRECPLLTKEGERNFRSKPKRDRRKKVKAYKAEADCSSDESVVVLAHHAMTASLADGWIIDSGATTHMCKNRELFKSLKMVPHTSVTMGDGNALSSRGVGDVEFMLKLPNGKSKNCVMQGVLFVPGLAYNLFSVAKAGKKGKVTVFKDATCEILDGKKVVASGSRVGNLYFLDCDSRQRALAASDGSEMLWHRKYGHLGQDSLKKLVHKDMVEGLEYDPSNDIGFCEACVHGKHHRAKFPKEGGKRAKKILGLVHSDVCGKIGTESNGGAKYFVTFIDDFTRYTWVYALRSKDQVFDKFVQWKAMVEKSSGHVLKTFRSDNGGEYTSRKFESYLKKEGIRHEVTIPKNPEQNGVAERMNRTLVEMVRAMLHKMPKSFWAEALNTAAYLRNRSPTVAVPDMTPYEALTGKKPNVADLHTFGSDCYAHVPKDERAKLDSKSRKCIFLGYGDRLKGYRLYDMARSKVIHSRDVIFRETQEKSEEPAQARRTVTLESVDVESEPDDGPGEIPAQDAPRRSGRKTQPPSMYGEWAMIAGIEEPDSYAAAMKSEDVQKWRTAMDKEMQSLKKNDVWDLVKLPPGRKTIGCKWVYKVKMNADGTPEKYKARLVAQGFAQKQGVDYDETFCPVVRTESVRTVIALSAQNNLKLHQMDITTAFLNGELQEEAYMKQPQGYVKNGNEDLVCRLKKSLYGLKQSPRCWNFALDRHLKQFGFKQSNADPCLYFGGSKEMVLVAVYVDDIIIATEEDVTMREIKDHISQKFEAKDLGEVKSFLGIQVHQTTDEIWIGQPAYTRSVLEKFGMCNSKPVATPVDSSTRLTYECGEKCDQQLYQAVVGTLLYLSVWTRPDIGYAVSSVAKFCADPRKEHWVAVKRILRYLKGTTNFGLSYTRSDNSGCVGFSDSDWAGDSNDRKSTSGYLFFIGSAPVSWRSKKQSCVALSSAEAEYVALACAAQEAMWLRQLLSEISGGAETILIYEDNQSAIQMAKNPQFHGRSKHIDIRYHFIRDVVNKKCVTLEYCPTDQMIADMLTKGLGKDKFSNLRTQAGICESANYNTDDIDN